MWYLDGKLSRANVNNIKISSLKQDCKTIEIYSKNSANNDSYICKIFYFIIPKVNDGNISATDLALDKFIQLHKKMTIGKVVYEIWFNRSNAVQTTLGDGNFLVAFQILS